jgi:hypothetical protein
MEDPTVQQAALFVMQSRKHAHTYHLHRTYKETAYECVAPNRQANQNQEMETVPGEFLGSGAQFGDRTVNLPCAGKGL